MAWMIFPHFDLIYINEYVIKRYKITKFQRKWQGFVQNICIFLVFSVLFAQKALTLRWQYDM